MDEISVKDIIFSYRHIYLENLKKLNKRLKKHLSIEGNLINDITVYLDNGSENNLRAKFDFKNGSFGSFVLNFSETFDMDSYLRYPCDIKKDSNGYYSSSKGVIVKDQKISKELECALKEEFYKNINAYYNNGLCSVSFSSYEITISCSDFIICYNCVGDVIYVFTSTPFNIKDILNTPVDISEFSDYHKSNIKKYTKIVDSTSYDNDANNPGDYTIKEQEKAVTLKRLKKNRLYKYI
jgi:hypothetical protein